MSDRILWRVVAPHFVAGLVTACGYVVDAAPILKWTIGSSRAWCSGVFKRKGWTVENLGPDPRE